MCLLKLKLHLPKTEDQRASWHIQYWEILSSICRFCIKTDAARKATSSHIWDVMKVDNSSCAEGLQLFPPSRGITCLASQAEPSRGRGRDVESIFLKEGGLIHPVTFLPPRKAGNLRTYVQIHFLCEKEAFCNKTGILSSFNKMSILFLETHKR